MRQISLHPSDIVVALDLVQLAFPRASEVGYRQIGDRVGVSHGEAHNAVRRLRAARLVGADSHTVAASSLAEFVIHGLRYAFPPMIGAPTRGVLTGPAAPFVSPGFSGEGEIVVWPSHDGKDRGASLVPLLPSAPALATHNTPLYELLVLADVLRIGRVRERRIAEGLLRDRLSVSASKS